MEINRANLTDEMVWNLFSNYDVIKYIREKRKELFSTDKLVSYADNLINERKYSPEDILAGKADEEINEFIKAEEMAALSIYKEEQERTYLPIKPKKERNHPKFFKRLVVTVLAGATIASIGVAVHNKIEKKELENDVSEYIGMLVANKESDEYLNKRNIVDQNTYAIEGDLNNQFFYNAPGIALDILKVSENSPELFDLCMFDTYFNLNYNRLSNMDDIFQNLKVNLLASNSSEIIQNKVTNSTNFLEYALNTCLLYGLINNDSTEYRDIVNAIESYKKIGYGNLDKYNKNVILDFINKCEKLLTILGKSQISTLEEQVAKKTSSLDKQGR